MNPKVQRVFTWLGPALMGFLFLGFIVAGWLPPPSPDDSAAETARFYQEHTTGIRIAALLGALSGTLLGPFVATLFVQMKRIEGPVSPLAYLQLVMGVLWATGIIVPATLWMAAAFRPERDPEITQIFHDAAWLPLMAVVFPLIAAHLSIAVATFIDKRRDPVFPRWAGHLNVWVATLLLPGVLVVFFKTGPFAWNGALTFWLASTAEGIWFLTMFVLLRRAIDQQEAEEADSASSGTRPTLAPPVPGQPS